MKNARDEGYTKVNTYNYDRSDVDYNANIKLATGVRDIATHS